LSRRHWTIKLSLLENKEYLIKELENTTGVVDHVYGIAVLCFNSQWKNLNRKF
jgi:hypothetical protein